MTKKEASFILMLAKNRECDNELNEALDMAIKALNNEDFNHEGFYNFLLNTIQPNEMEKYRSMFLSSGKIVN